MADEILADAVMRLIQDQNQLEEEKEYRAWYAALLLLREDYKREPKKEWTADLELQPLRWMQLGLTLIQSPKITAYVQLANGVQGPPLSSFLPYPVFQAVGRCAKASDRPRARRPYLRRDAEGGVSFPVPRRCPRFTGSPISL